MKNRHYILPSFRTLLLGLFLIPSLLFADDYDRAEAMLEDAFVEVLDREPRRSEYRNYVDWIVDERIRYGELIRQIESDYLDDRGGQSGRYGDRRPASNEREAREWVKDIFNEVLDREPGPLELTNYATVSLDEGLTKSQLKYLIEQDYEIDARSGGREAFAPADADEIIREAYLDILNREPDEEGLRNYRRLMIDKGWSEARIRDAIAESKEALWRDTSTLVKRAYEDLLDRAPSEMELKDAVDTIIKKRISERDYRKNIRKSREYQYDRPRRMIMEAYRTVMLREADPGAFEGLRKKIVNDGWNTKRLEEHLRASNEYRAKVIPKMVDLAYEEVLKREPDPSGKRFYLSKAMQGWTFEDIKQHMLDSDEYRERFK
jgi:hypothetical protein